MNRRAPLILATVALLTAVPLRAQRNNCDIDLSPVIATLVRAQSSSSSGNVMEAARLIADARADLEELESACLDADGEVADTGPIAAPELSETLVLDSEFGAFTVRFPSGWQGQELEGLQALGNSDAVFDMTLADTELPSLMRGEVITLIGLVTARSMGFVDEATVTPGPLEFLNLLGSDAPDLLGHFDGAAPLDIGGQEAAVGTFIADEHVVTVLMSDFGTTGPVPERLYGLIMLITPRNEQADWQPTAEAMLASITLNEEPD